MRVYWRPSTMHCKWTPVCPGSLQLMASGQPGCVLVKIPAQADRVGHGECHLLSLAFVPTLSEASPLPDVSRAHLAPPNFSTIKIQLKCHCLCEAALLSPPKTNSVFTSHSHGALCDSMKDGAVRMRMCPSSLELVRPRVIFAAPEFKS
jgi:hypothetical protein